MLQASRQEDHAYTQIAQSIIANSVNPGQDLQELWRRLAFNLLITNVDDHLQNHGFLHVEHGHLERVFVLFISDDIMRTCNWFRYKRQNVERNLLFF